MIRRPAGAMIRRPATRPREGMRLDTTHRLLERIDPTPIRDLVARHLAPIFDAPDRPIWQHVATRMQWIGASERPADVAYRKMRPRGYLQLCLRNDEQPCAPWAVDLAGLLAPETLVALDAAVTRPLAELCGRHYGEGVLYFCGFAILGPSGEVPRHRDMPHDVDKKAWSHHLHVPITGAEATEFTIGKQTFVFEAGGVYEIDNQRKHAVVHRGAGYRVNVMLDYCPVDQLVLRNRASSSTDAQGEQGSRQASRSQVLISVEKPSGTAGQT